MSQVSEHTARLQKDEFIAEFEESLGRPLAEALANVHYNMTHMCCRYPEAVEARFSRWKPTASASSCHSNSSKGQRSGSIVAPSDASTVQVPASDASTVQVDDTDIASFVSSSDATVTETAGAIIVDAVDRSSPPPPARTGLLSIAARRMAAESGTSQSCRDSSAPPARTGLLSIAARRMAAESGTSQSCGDSSAAPVKCSDAELDLAKRMRIRACEGDQANDVSRLHDSCQVSHVEVALVPSVVNLKTGTINRVDVIIDSLNVGHAVDAQKKVAKQLAAKCALERLGAIHRSLGIEELPTGAKLIREAKNHVGHAQLVSSAFHDADKVSTENKGSKLLMKMGYSGKGGLGKDGQGRAEPIVEATLATDRRQGIGATAEGDLSKSQIERLLRDFMSSDEALLVFGKDLSKENRATVHVISGRLGLSHKSHGSGESRQLVVQKREGTLDTTDSGPPPNHNGRNARSRAHSAPAPAYFEYQHDYRQHDQGNRHSREARHRRRHRPY